MVQVLLKAFDIVELVVQRNGQSVSLTEIADALQMNQATAANIINTLVSRGKFLILIRKATRYGATIH